MNVRVYKINGTYYSFHTGGTMRYSATKLRQNLYNILDKVIEEGITVEIERKGHILKIITETPASKWDQLEPHNIISDNPESIVSIDWSDEWHRGDGL